MFIWNRWLGAVITNDLFEAIAFFSWKYSPLIDMNTVADELFDFVVGKTSNSFSEFHEVADNENLLNRFIDFFGKPGTQLQIDAAIRINESVLKKTGADNLKFFFQGVYHRERGKKMEYDKQRDHTVHTVYNYVLGAFLFEKIPEIKDAFSVHFKNHSIKIVPPKITQELIFFHLWQYTSLLHDIGYLFEGQADPQKLQNVSDMAKFGAKMTNEFFEKWVWILWRLPTPTLWKMISSKIEKEWVKIDDSSLISIFSSLIDLGKLEYLSKDIQYEIGSHDAFDIWSKSFSVSESKAMGKRVISLKNFALYLISEGLPLKDGKSIRLLDHGVISGLITFNNATLIYEMVSMVEKLYLEKATTPEEKITVPEAQPSNDNEIEVSAPSEDIETLPTSTKSQNNFSLRKFDPNLNVKIENSPGAEINIQTHYQNYDDAIVNFFYPMKEEDHDENNGHDRGRKSKRVEKDKEAHVRLRNNDLFFKIAKDLDFWWNGLAWATAATALHNYLQVDWVKDLKEINIQAKDQLRDLENKINETEKVLEKLKGKDPQKEKKLRSDLDKQIFLAEFWDDLKVDTKKNNKTYKSKIPDEIKTTPISLNDDPLTYLGILVDIIQEWDRYRVKPDQVNFASIATSLNTEIMFSRKKLYIQYPHRSIYKKVRSAFETTLVGWERFIVLKIPPIGLKGKN